MPTLRHLFYNFRASRRNSAKPETLASYCSLLNRCVSDLLDVEAADLTTEVMKRKFDELCRLQGPRGPGISQATTVMRVLKAIFNYGVRHHALKTNPIAKIPCYVKDCNRTDESSNVRSIALLDNKPSAKIHPLSDDELRKVHAAIEADTSIVLRDYLLFLLYTGFRRSESAGLRWEDLTWTAGKVLVRVGNVDIPVGDRVQAILLNRHKANRLASKFVFYTGCNCISLYEKRHKRISQRIGVDFSLGSCRATFYRIARQSLTPEQYRRLEARHSGVPGTEELREAMQAVESAIYQTATQKQRVRLELSHVQKACAAQ